MKTLKFMPMALSTLATSTALVLGFASMSAAQESDQATLSAATRSADAPRFGIYDPAGTYSQDGSVSIEHLFLPWEDVDLASLNAAEDYAEARGRTLLVTVEPWNWSQEWRLTPDQLKDRILAGSYDENMRAICGILGDFEVPVTVRWGHEMEDRSGQFTWSNWAPDDYISAYRREVEICRAEAPNVKYMWSPLGENGLEQYYPGDAYVDTIGLSVFGLQPYDEKHYGKPRRFSEVLKPRYERVIGYGKPVVVAELGFEGSQAYIDNWRREIRQEMPQFPRLSSVVYFNDREVHPWPDGFGLPDWRHEPSAIN